MQKKEGMPSVSKTRFFFAKAANSLIKTLNMPKVNICCIYIFMSKRQINPASVENVRYLIVNKCYT